MTSSVWLTDWLSAYSTDMTCLSGRLALLLSPLSKILKIDLLIEIWTNISQVNNLSDAEKIQIGTKTMVNAIQEHSTGIAIIQTDSNNAVALTCYPISQQKA